MEGAVAGGVDFVEDEGVVAAAAARCMNWRRRRERDELVKS